MRPSRPFQIPTDPAVESSLPFNDVAQVRKCVTLVASSKDILQLCSTKQEKTISAIHNRFYNMGIETGQGGLALHGFFMF